MMRVAPSALAVIGVFFDLIPPVQLPSSIRIISSDRSDTRPLALRGRRRARLSSCHPCGEGQEP